jgi:hypothetical protein
LPPTENQAQYVAEVLVEGTATSAMTVAAYAKGTHGEVDLTEVFRALQADGRAVKAGDLAVVEAVLAAQVVALNVIFGELARRAALHMDEHLDATDRNLRLAMKAQSQCRATAETLAIIKQGPAVYARQANIAHGPQQINNGTGAKHGLAPGRENRISQPRTIEDKRWRKAGHRNGGHSRQKQSDAGGHGSKAPGRGRRKVRRNPSAMGANGARSRFYGRCRVCYPNSESF